MRAGDIGGIAGGYDTARVPVDPTSVAGRAMRNADARGNLAAMLCSVAGVDPGAAVTGDPAVRKVAGDFAKLAAMLGLPETRGGDDG